VGEGDLAGMVREEPVGGRERAEERLWQYAQVVGELAASRPLLPARFGSVVDDPDAASGFIRQNRTELSQALDDVAGAVEIAVRVREIDEAGAPGADPGRADIGTAYMARQLGRQHHAQEISDHLEPLRRVARRAKTRTLPDRATLFAGAYLVDAAAIEKFTDLLADLDRDLSSVQTHCTGPWPVDSFAPAPAP